MADERCTFLVRGINTTPKDIHPCGRTISEHPVTGKGQYENHMYMLDKRHRRLYT